MALVLLQHPVDFQVIYLNDLCAHCKNFTLTNTLVELLFGSNPKPKFVNLFSHSLDFMRRQAPLQILHLKSIRTLQDRIQSAAMTHDKLLSGLFIMRENSSKLNYTPSGLIDYSQLYPLTHERFPAFEFEKLSFETLSGIGNFFYNYWYLSLVVGAIYLAVIFYLQRVMKSYEPVKLKWQLFTWNIILGIFSIVGFSRTAPPLLYRISLPNGFYRSICHIIATGEGEIFWAILFTLGKYLELLDTIFVVLRKKPLESAQWFHHVVTLVGATLLMPYMEPWSMYVLTLNYGVSLIYPYFALKVIDLNVPNIVSRIITTCQFVQFVINIIVNLSSGFLFVTGYKYCHRHPSTIIFSIVVNIAFLIIFGNVLRRVFSRSTSKVKTE